MYDIFTISNKCTRGIKFLFFSQIYVGGNTGHGTIECIVGLYQKRVIMCNVPLHIGKTVMLNNANVRGKRLVMCCTKMLRRSSIDRHKNVYFITGLLNRRVGSD